MSYGHFLTFVATFAIGWVIGISYACYMFKNKHWSYDK